MRELYIPEPRRSMKLGDEYFITNYSRHAGETWTGPFKVTRMTETQFVVGARRFMKTTGYEVGSGGWRVKAELSTPEFVQNVAEVRANDATARDTKEAEATVAEMKLRIRYKARDIFNDDVQQLLGKIRQRAEYGRGRMKSFIKTASEATVKKGWNLSRELDWDGAKKYQNGILFFENARELHHRLVKLYHAFEDGDTIRHRDGESTIDWSNNQTGPQVIDILKAAINVERRKQETEFFGHRYDDDDSEHWAEWIAVLRDIDNTENDYPSIRVLEDA